MASGEKVSLAVLLVLVAIDDDGLGSGSAGAASAATAAGGRGRRGSAALGILRIGIGIADHHRQARRIGRPFVALQASLDLGELHRFTAAAREEPYLVAGGLAGTG